MKILLLLSVPDPDLEIRGRGGLGGWSSKTLRRGGVYKINFLGPLGTVWSKNKREGEMGSGPKT